MRTRHYPSRIRDWLRRFTPERIKMSKIWKMPVQEDERKVLEKKYKSHNKNFEKMTGKRLA